MSLLDFSPTTGATLVSSGLDVIVTGAGGWLGQATLEMLESSLGAELASRTHVFASSRRSIKLRSGTQLDVYPLSELSRLKIGPYLLAHYAFATREFVAQLGAAEYIARNQAITELVTRYLAKSRPVGMVVVSSGAVYFSDDLATNPYGVLKARDEQQFLKVAQESGGTGPISRTVIPRLFNLAGPFLNKSDYVLGSIIRDIRNGGPIQLHAAHPVIRSYVHVADLVDLAFAIMVGKGPVPLEAFDTAGEREIEVGELAKLAASLLDASGMEIRRPPLDGEPADRYVGNSVVIRALASAYGIKMKTLPTQIKDTAKFTTD